MPRLVSPSDGSALTARRQVFVWTADGSKYRLRIGTTPGAADVFESPPLGDATSVTVDGLPLTDATLFVELSSGPDDARVPRPRKDHMGRDTRAARDEPRGDLVHRKRPASGYGSAGSFACDELAVYHLFEGSNQNTDPPLLKLEPADGSTSPSYLPETTDLAHPAPTI